MLNEMGFWGWGRIGVDLRFSLCEGVEGWVGELLVYRSRLGV